MLVYIINMADINHNKTSNILVMDALEIPIFDRSTASIWNH